MKVETIVELLEKYPELTREELDIAIKAAVTYIKELHCSKGVYVVSGDAFKEVPYITTEELGECKKVAEKYRPPFKVDPEKYDAFVESGKIHNSQMVIDRAEKYGKTLGKSNG